MTVSAMVSCLHSNEVALIVIVVYQSVIVMLTGCILLGNQHTCLNIKPDVFIRLREAHNNFSICWPLRYLTHECSWVFISFKCLIVLPKKSYLSFINEFRNFFCIFYFVNVYQNLIFLIFTIFFFQFASSKNVQIFAICDHWHIVKTYILISIGKLVFPWWNMI